MSDIWNAIVAIFAIFGAIAAVVSAWRSLGGRERAFQATAEVCNRGGRAVLEVSLRREKEGASGKLDAIKILSPRDVQIAAMERDCSAVGIVPYGGEVWMPAKFSELVPCNMPFSALDKELTTMVWVTSAGKTEFFIRLSFSYGGPISRRSHLIINCMAPREITAEQHATRR